MNKLALNIFKINYCFKIPYKEQTNRAYSRKCKTCLPVIFPIAASAVSSWRAAVLLAKVSGILVPSATKVIPVTLTSNPMIQPSSLANCNKKLKSSENKFSMS